MALGNTDRRVLGRPESGCKLPRRFSDAQDDSFYLTLPPKGLFNANSQKSSVFGPPFFNSLYCSSTEKSPFFPRFPIVLP
ncbi:MAG: hypothetical protein IJG50_01790 [Clostridia bacterium]|nr:hypothetical protein [Clostridia bacterium]